jgi:hypothetical protein
VLHYDRLPFPRDHATPGLERTPACVAAVLAYNGKEAVKLSERLFAIPIGQLLE